MRFPQAIFLAGLAVAALTGSAAAQAYSGQEVSVSPLPGGSNVLLYPGGQYMRVVPPLLQPGERNRDMGAVPLHMPARHRTAATRVARAEPKATPQPRKPAAPPRTASAPARTPPPPPQATATIKDYSSLGPANDQGASLFIPTSPPPPAAKPQPSKPQSKPQQPQQKPQQPVQQQPQLARLEPTPPRTIAQPPAAEEEPLAPGLIKRSVILFAPNATDPAQSALGAIKFLAGDLNTAMTGPGARIQLQAYGGTRGDKGSDARRLSLKRALAIRQVLIDDGVAADRIDVHAGGGVDDGGPADRVDVYVKA